MTRTVCLRFTVGPCDTDSERLTEDMKRNPELGAGDVEEDASMELSS